MKTVCVVLIVATCILLACTSKSNETVESSGNVYESVDKLYHDYLTNDSVGAKRSMILVVELLSQTKDLDYAKGNMWFAFGRLMCIEKHLGNSDAMEMYYEKTKEWYDVCLKNFGAWMNVCNDVDLISIDHFCSELLWWDQQFTQGLGPNYLTEANHRAPTIRE
jgi:hypothetical protein